MINLAIDVADEHLRAKRIDPRRISPDYEWNIQGQDVRVWVDVSGISYDEIEDLVWATVMITVR